MADLEIDAMSALNAALEPLEGPARERVLAWAAAKFELSAAQRSNDQSQVNARLADADSSSPDFEEVGDVVHAAQPSNGPEHAVVVAYWLQAVRGQDGWTGSDVNSTLKNMGLGLANVTKTLDLLKARKPSLVMQVGKSGRSRQARKTYKLTTAGVRFVEQMIANAGAEETP